MAKICGLGGFHDVGDLGASCLWLYAVPVPSFYASYETLLL